MPRLQKSLIDHRKSAPAFFINLEVCNWDRIDRSHGTAQCIIPGKFRLKSHTEKDKLIAMGNGSKDHQLYTRKSFVCSGFLVWLALKLESHDHQ